jgi:uncharacterized protein
MKAWLVVVDTNILVSAAIKRFGNEARVLDLVASGHFLLAYSESILAEYAEVLLRPKLCLDPNRVSALLNLFELVGTAAVIPSDLRLSVSSDESDNCFLECAEVAGADFLVTGNLRHFPRKWKDTSVVSARELLQLHENRR